MKGRIFLFLTTFITLFFWQVSPVLAVTPPDFPACSAQVGSPIIVSYSSGTHGIVGDSATHTGKDTVYAINSRNVVLQCFCGTDGSGIQTNWWKASSLTDPDIKVLISLGWKYVQNGSIWGLSNEPYIAQHLNYACGGTGGGISDPAVLGLATTGNTSFVNNLFFVGFVSVIFGTHIALCDRKKRV